jgi:hypothetical protein
MVRERHTKTLLVDFPCKILSFSIFLNLFDFVTSMWQLILCKHVDHGCLRVSYKVFVVDLLFEV